MRATFKQSTMRLAGPVHVDHGRTMDTRAQDDRSLTGLGTR